MDSLKNIESLLYFIPEILLVVFAAAVIILDLIVKDRESDKVAYLALVGLGCSLLAILITRSNMAIIGTDEPINLFLGMIRLDEFAIFFKVLLILATSATILFSLRSEELDVKLKGEYYAFAVSCYLRDVPDGIVNQSADDIHLFRNGKSHLLHPRWIPNT